MERENEKIKCYEQNLRTLVIVTFIIMCNQRELIFVASDVNGYEIGSNGRKSDKSIKSLNFID